MKINKSLDPIVNINARVLILGSMPGEESLRRQEYYGYPRNHFWPLMAEISGFDLPDSYNERISMLDRIGIALWDVIGSCFREGSLDTNIKDEEPNDLFRIIEEMIGLRVVIFNGQKSAKSFKRHFGFTSLEQAGIEYRVMPSTSPANTAGYEKKLAAWSEIKNFIFKNS